MRYIVVEGGNGAEHAILLPEYMTFGELDGLITPRRFKRGGRCDKDSGKWKCYGVESVELVEIPKDSGLLDRGYPCL